jgi:branched-chain amino acid transport system substrate-binding protein
MRDLQALLRIGVLPPSSNFVPFLAADLIAALKFGLTEARTDAELITEFAGYNADLKLVLPKVQELLFARQVNCVIAPLNISLVEQLAKHFEGQGVPLIALNLEEDPQVETAKNPYVFVNSFHLWPAAWMSGYLGGLRFGPRGAAMTALHESGYGLAFAFQLGLEAANGSLVNSAVTHRDASDEDPAPSIANIAAAEPDFIWAGYSGKEAVSFLKAYEVSGCKGRIPVLGLQPMVETHVREAAGDAIHGIYFVTHRTPCVEGNGPTGLLAQALGRTPNPYALLAYESAHLLAAAAHATNEPGNLSANLSTNLRKAVFQGPRGLTRFDDAADSDLVFCVHQISAGSDSVEQVAAPPLLYQQQMLARQRLQKQGWVNPYLCA